MLNFKKLTDTNFSIVESVIVYLEMALNLIIPILKTALLCTVFILFGQALFSLLPHNTVINICFWVWVGFVFSLSTASFFKTSEDIILNKSAQIYANIARVLVMSAKLFAVGGLIIGALAILIFPIYFLTNPLFLWPYKVLVSIFIIAFVPFVYFAPLAVALREANILNSFTFSYYMVLQRWGTISKSILTQVIFTSIIAFWLFFVVSLLFFPNSGDFFNFIITQASAISEQSRNLYVRFFFWEVVQIFVFTFITGIFIGINTILFLYYDGSISKIVEEGNLVKVNHTKFKKDIDAKFVDMLENSKPVTIDTKAEEEEIHHKTRKEVLNEIYPAFPEEEYSNGQKNNSVSPNDDIVVIEDNYPNQ